MKIEIDLMDIDIPYIQQMEAVCEYIKKNTTHIEKHEFLGIEIAKTPVVKETKKGTGVKIETTNRNFHVSCRKTKGGTYKFIVWQAV
jgi:threonine dehydrogenase-like Zn-dependent dehydrogenase